MSEVNLTEAEMAEKKKAKKARQRSAWAQAAAQQVPSPAREPDTKRTEPSAGKHEERGDVEAAPTALEPIEPSSENPVGPTEQTASPRIQTEAPAGEPAKLPSRAPAEAERPVRPGEGKSKGRSIRQTYSGDAPELSPSLAPADKAEASALPASDSACVRAEETQQAVPGVLEWQQDDSRTC